MRNLKSLLAIFALPLFVFSCKKEKGPDLADKNLYIPVDIGHQYHYEVDSSYWTTDSSGVIKFEYRETYETDVPDNTGGLQTRVKIERKGDLSSGFGLVGYAYIQKYYNKNNKEYTIERTQNNIKYVLLRTPIVDGDSVNRNAKNFGQPDFWSAAHIERLYAQQAHTERMLGVDTSSGACNPALAGLSIFISCVGHACMYMGTLCLSCDGCHDQICNPYMLHGEPLHMQELRSQAVLIRDSNSLGCQMVASVLRLLQRSCHCFPCATFSPTFELRSV